MSSLAAAFNRLDGGPLPLLPPPLPLPLLLPPLLCVVLLASSV
jgi:hypothetical protein